MATIVLLAPTLNIADVVTVIAFHKNNNIYRPLYLVTDTVSDGHGDRQIR